MNQMLEFQQMELQQQQMKFYDDETGFEGPEKKLDIRFGPITKSGKNQPSKLGLRTINKERWQQVLDSARCTIISQTSNEYMDSYVLSESSLFVYPRRAMIKTCGTTTLLHLIAKMKQVAFECGLEVEMVLFSRKNLNHPSKQIFPHCSFNDEVQFLNKTFQGQAYVMGPLNKDHWNLYIADFRKGNTLERTEQTFEVMMHDLDPEVMKQFFKRDGVSAWDTTVSSGIANLLPGSIIDDFQFDPCGYSMNGLLNQWYWTIHITPESHCSYVSFDTNIALPNFNQLLEKVLAVFKPGRFTAALYVEDGAPCGDPYSAFDIQQQDPNYVIQNKTVHGFDGGYDVVVCNFTSQQHIENQKSLTSPQIIESSQNNIEFVYLRIDKLYNKDLYAENGECKNIEYRIIANDQSGSLVNSEIAKNLPFITQDVVAEQLNNTHFLYRLKVNYPVGINNLNVTIIQGTGPDNSTYPFINVDRFVCEEIPVTGRFQFNFYRDVTTRFDIAAKEESIFFSIDQLTKPLPSGRLQVICSKQFQCSLQEPLYFNSLYQVKIKLRVDEYIIKFSGCTGPSNFTILDVIKNEQYLIQVGSFYQHTPVETQITKHSYTPVSSFSIWRGLYWTEEGYVTVPNKPSLLGLKINIPVVTFKYWPLKGNKSNGVYRTFIINMPMNIPLYTGIDILDYFNNQEKTISAPATSVTLLEPRPTFPMENFQVSYLTSVSPTDQYVFLEMTNPYLNTTGYIPHISFNFNQVGNPSRITCKYPFSFMEGLGNEIKIGTVLVISKQSSDNFTGSALVNEQTLKTFNFPKYNSTGDTQLPVLESVQYFKINDTHFLVRVHATDSVSGVFKIDVNGNILTVSDLVSGTLNNGIFEKIIKFIPIQEQTYFAPTLSNPIQSWKPKLKMIYPFSENPNCQFTGSFDTNSNSFVIPFKVENRVFEGVVEYELDIEGIKWTSQEIVSVLGDSAQFRVIEDNADQMAPIIDVLTPFPSDNFSIPMDGSPIEFGWDINIVDDLNGFSYAEFGVRSDRDPLQDFTKFTIENATAGNLLSSSYRLKLTAKLPCTTQTYYISKATIVDTKGYKSLADLHELTGDFQTPFHRILFKTITINCPAASEISPPQLTLFDFSPKTIDTSSPSDHSRTVTFTFTVSDSDTPISQKHLPTIYLTHSHILQINQTSKISNILDNGKTIQYTCQLVIPYGTSISAPLPISIYGLADSLLNFNGYLPSNLKSKFGDSSYYVQVSFGFKPYISSTSTFYSTKGGPLTIYGRNLGLNDPSSKVEIDYDGSGFNSIAKTFDGGIMSITTGISPRSTEFNIRVFSQSEYSNVVKVVPSTESPEIPNPTSPPTPTPSPSQTPIPKPTIPPTLSPTKPPTCKGDPICGGPSRGNCDPDLGCVCVPPWMDLDCGSMIINNTKPNANDTSPGTDTDYEGKLPNGETVKFSTLIRIESIREIGANNNIVSEFFIKEWTFRPIVNSTHSIYLVVNLENIELDDSISTDKPEESSSRVGITIPQFSTRAILDPDYSVLVNSKKSGGNCTDSSKLTGAQIAGIVIGSVCGAAVIGVMISYYIWKKKKVERFNSQMETKMRTFN
eukprot:gene1086-1377_t